MKKGIVAVFLFVACIQLSRAQANLPTSTAKASTPEAQELLDLSKSKWQWMSDKMVDTLNGLFTENCVFVHMGGSWGKTSLWRVRKYFW